MQIRGLPGPFHSQAGSKVPACLGCQVWTRRRKTDVGISVLKSMSQINSPLGASELKEKKEQESVSRMWCYLSCLESSWENQPFQPKADYNSALVSKLDLRPSRVLLRLRPHREQGLRPSELFSSCIDGESLVRCEPLHLGITIL